MSDKAKTEKQATKSARPVKGPRRASNQMAPSTKGPAPEPRYLLKLVTPEGYAPSRPRIGGVHLPLGGDEGTRVFLAGQSVEVSADEYEAALAARLPQPFSFEGQVVDAEQEAVTEDEQTATAVEPQAEHSTAPDTEDAPAEG